MSIFKTLLRESFITLRLDVTKNIKYDRLTRKILKKLLRQNDNCIDIGCHHGEILDLIIKYAPRGNHYAFEPIPHLFTKLGAKYKERTTVFPYALSDTAGKTTFNHVRNAPAYSGIKKRRYDIANPEIEEIVVEMKCLDDVISKDERIHFIKIDVEGNEFGVLKGAKNLLKKEKPVILFECGKGASDYYGTKPSDIYTFLTGDIGLNIFTLSAFLKKGKALSSGDFDNFFNTNKEYYFVAVNGRDGF